MIRALSSAGLYFFGMASNDIADREKDRQLAPGRVLPSGRLSVRSAVFAAAWCLILSLGAQFGIGTRLLLERLFFWTLVVIFIVGYNVLVKVPPFMGLVRACNLLLGMAVHGDVGVSNLIKPWMFAVIALPEFVYVTSLTYVSTLEDRELDRRKLGIGTACMALGALLAAVFVPIMEGACEGGHGRIFRYMVESWHGLIFSGLLAGWVVIRATRARDKKGLMLMVRDGVGGIILLDAALAACFDGIVPGLYVASLLIPAALSVALFKRLA